MIKRFTVLGPKLVRLWMVAFAAALALVVLPHLLNPDNVGAQRDLHGQLSNGRIAYRDVPLSDVLADVERLTGFRAVAFPAVAARRFSGGFEIDVPGGDRQLGEADGKAAVEKAAADMGLQLRKAGPHWAVSEGPSP